jgi:hypothetical protein
MKPIQPKNGIKRCWRALCPALIWGAGLAALLFQAGCAPGLISVLGTPTSDETKIPAEYNLAKQKDQKILVLVDQPSYLNAHPNLRFFLTDAINKIFQLNAKIQASYIINYDTLADFRSGTADFSLLGPERVGSALGADFVLHVTIANYQVTQIGDTGYLNASLDVQASVIKVANGEKVWPTLEQSRLVQVGCESERRGRDAVGVRLASAAARCITRYLYDCPKKQFKISDERTTTEW